MNMSRILLTCLFILPSLSLCLTDILVVCSSLIKDLFFISFKVLDYFKSQKRGKARKLLLTGIWRLSYRSGFIHSCV